MSIPRYSRGLIVSVVRPYIELRRVSRVVWGPPEDEGTGREVDKQIKLSIELQAVRTFWEFQFIHHCLSIKFSSSLCF